MIKAVFKQLVLSLWWWLNLFIVRVWKQGCTIYAHEQLLMRSSLQSTQHFWRRTGYNVLSLNPIYVLSQSFSQKLTETWLTTKTTYTCRWLMASLQRKTWKPRWHKWSALWTTVKSAWRAEARCICAFFVHDHNIIQPADDWSSITRTKSVMWVWVIDSHAGNALVPGCCYLPLVLYWNIWADAHLMYIYLLLPTGNVIDVCPQKKNC